MVAGAVRSLTSIYHFMGFDLFWLNENIVQDNNLVSNVL